MTEALGMCIEQWDVKVWTHLEECGFHLQEMAASRKELKFSKDDHDKFSLFQGTYKCKGRGYGHTWFYCTRH